MREANEGRRVAMRVSGVSIAVNLALTAFKLAAGLLARSGAMVSDAVHSASDVFSTLVVMGGINLAARQPDRDHPYGHERLECVAAILLAVILAATGAAIGAQGIAQMCGGRGELATPGMLALTAAAVSIAVKEWMFRYTRKAARRVHSGALMADAWHHRSDALSSVGAFVGILGARLGWPILDPLASAVISLFICKAALDIFRDAVDKMVDKACDAQTVQAIAAAVRAQEGVAGLDEMRTRQFGARAYVDMEIAVDGRLSLEAAHRIAEGVHRAVEAGFPQVKHCMVHVNPARPGGKAGPGEEDAISERAAPLKPPPPAACGQLEQTPDPQEESRQAPLQRSPVARNRAGSGR